MPKRSPFILMLLLAGLSRAVFAAAQELDSATHQKVRELYSQARTLYREKQYEKSTETFQEVLKLLPATEEGQLDSFRARVNYDIGCNYAVLTDKTQSLEALSRAVALGYWDAKYLAKDPTLKSLRGEEEFQALVEQSKRLLTEGFGLPDITGQKILTKDNEDKVLIIDVWGTWCGPCRREIPAFKRLQTKYGDRGLRVIGLTWEKKPPNPKIQRHVEDFVEKNKINYPVLLLSRDAFKALRVGSFPTTFFVGRDGFVAERIRGAQPYKTLESAALKLLDEPAK